MNFKKATPPENDIYQKAFKFACNRMGIEGEGIVWFEPTEEQPDPEITKTQFRTEPFTAPADICGSCRQWDDKIYIRKGMDAESTLRTIYHELYHRKEFLTLKANSERNAAEFENYMMNEFRDHLTTENRKNFIRTLNAKLNPKPKQQSHYDFIKQLNSEREQLRKRLKKEKF